MANNRVVLVTAGSAGLGAAVATVFAKNGFKVAINYNSDSKRANKLLAELDGSGTGREHLAIQADLASESDVRRLVKETYQKLGRIDTVFSNGGWTQFRDTAQIDENVFNEDWDRAFIMNVKSHLWLLHAAKTHLSETEGAFITTASLAGIQGMGSSLAYSATKAAQIHMIKGLASMVAPKIRVSSVSPGLLETAWSERFSDKQKDEHRSQTKLKRFVNVDDVAAQVLGLSQNRSMTGVNIVIDAGFLS